MDVRRAVFVFAVAALVLFGLGAPASAAGRPRPEIELIRLDGEVGVIPAGELCPFEVTFQDWGHIRIATHFAKDGSVLRQVANPSLVSTYSANGLSFTSPDRGLDKTTFDWEAGTFTVHGTGIHLRVDGEFRQIGLWVLVYDIETGELLSEEYHGNFDGGDMAAGADYICSRLTPTT